MKQHNEEMVEALVQEILCGGIVVGALVLIAVVITLVK